MSWALNYLTKSAAGKLRLLLNKLSPVKAEELLRQLGMNPELKTRLTVGLRRKTGVSVAETLVGRQSKAIPEMMHSQYQAGYLNKMLERPFIEHVKKHYGPVNVVKELGGGAESGALQLAPSRVLRKMTGETGHVVLKYGKSNPLHPGMQQYAASVGTGNVTPIWRLRSFTPPAPMAHETVPGKIYTWLEPVLTPAAGRMPERIVKNRATRAGLSSIDLGRTQAGEAQVGYWRGNRGRDRLVPLDRGIVYPKGGKSVFQDELSAIRYGFKLDASGKVIVPPPKIRLMKPKTPKGPYQRVPARAISITQPETKTRLATPTNWRPLTPETNPFDKLPKPVGSELPPPVPKKPQTTYW